jgi:large subunit ribosomal protein L25
MARFKATKRNDTGTRTCRALRRTGMIPGIIYGHKRPPQAISLSHHDIEVALLHGERVLAVDVDGTEQNVIVKDVQYDPFGQHILHVDLARVSLDERVTVTVPIVLRGTPAGVEDGGVLRQAAAELSLECTVRSIPEEIRASVTGLGIGDSLLMADLALPEGAVLQDDPDTMVCNVTVVAEEVAEAAPAPAEAAPQPEVIGEKPAEQEPRTPAEEK